LNLKESLSRSETGSRLTLTITTDSYCDLIAIGSRLIRNLFAIYSQHDLHSAQTAQPSEQSHPQVAWQTAPQHDLTSACCSFAGTNENKNRIAEKRMMDFIVIDDLELRCLDVKRAINFAKRTSHFLNPKDLQLGKRRRRKK
jgi:hypothetical protein